MPFWSSQKIIKTCSPTKSGHDIIGPKFEESKVDFGAYQLSPGIEAKISGQPKQLLKDGFEIQIPVGQTALIMTKEYVKMPDNVIGFISVKSGRKWAGLINVSGFHVDPGFNGHLTFALHNAGSKTINLIAGTPAFSIWFADFDQSVRPARGTAFRKQITQDMLDHLSDEVPSAAKVLEDFKELKDKYTRYTALLTIILSLIGAFLLRLVSKGG